MKKNKGFTIIELLTVMSIIVILISVLVPSLQMVRKYARKVVQKGQFHDINMGLELFSIDFDGYPDSIENAVITVPSDAYCGAMKLCEAMLGQDGLGFHPDSRFRRDGLDGPGGTDLYPPNPTPKQRRERKNPYIDIISKYKLCLLMDVYGTASFADTGSFDPCSPVISDMFYKVRGQVSADKLGMPVLYYKAHIGELNHDPNTPSKNIYDVRDNDLLAELKIPDRKTTDHPLHWGGAGNPDVFYENIFSKKVAGFNRPYNEESYILISAGWDGLYGTRDDVYNFNK